MKNTRALDRLAVAAEALLEILRPDEQRFLRRVAEEHRWPMLAVMLGAFAVVREFPRGL